MVSFLSFRLWHSDEAISFTKIVIMDTGWILLIGAGVFIIIIVLVRQNRKDEKSFVDQLNRNYPKSKDEEGDADIDEAKK